MAGLAEISETLGIHTDCSGGFPRNAGIFGRFVAKHSIKKIQRSVWPERFTVCP